MDQHWVPKSYLAAWADPDCPPKHKPFVHVFDRDGRNHRKKAPANILKMPDLYTVFRDGRRDLKIETFFGGIERDFVRVRRLLETGAHPSQEDVAALYAFVGSMLARPPQSIDFVQKQLSNMVQKARSIRVVPGAKIPASISTGARMSLAEFEAYANNGMETWFPEILAANLEVIAKLFRFDILVNDTPTPFLTSDNPAVMFFADPDDGKRRLYPRGMGHPACRIMIPMSPRLALMLWHGKSGTGRFVEMAGADVIDINFRTILRSRAHLISNTADLYFVSLLLQRLVEDGASDDTSRRS